MDGALRTQEFAGGRVHLTLSGGVAAVLLNNPARLNALDMAMWDALGRIFERLAGDPTVRVVTLQGAGERAFCVGADISEFGERRSDAETATAYNVAVARAESALETLPMPVVALVRGHCIGGGFGLAMRCDIRLSSSDACFAVTPARLGLGYGYDGVASLCARLGHAVTADLLFSARRMAASEALSKGVCDAVYPADAFDEAASAYVAVMAANAPLTQRAVKAALLDLARPSDQRDRAGVEAQVAACFDSMDYAEGQRAFAEKRAPRFEGR